MSEMLKQKNNLKTLIHLMIENPNLRVLPFVDYEVVCDDSFTRWVGSFGKAFIDEVYCGNEKIYIRTLNEGDLIEQEADYLLDNNDIMEDEAFKKAEEIVNNFNWEKVIILYIDLP